MTVDEKWQEVALVDIAYEILNNSTESMNYRDVFKQAADLKGLTDEELMELLPQVFTEMNLDGRFLCISPSEWGLKKWYTTQHIEESIEALARSKGIDDDDDVYGFDDEEESDADFSDDEDFDTIDDADEIDEDAADEDIDEDIEEEDEDLAEDIGEDAEFEEESDFEEADGEEEED